MKPFADGAGYAVLRLLEKPSGGRIQAPKLESLEGDLKELETFFRELSVFRDELADAGTARPWGLAPTVANKIQQGKIEHFSEKLDAMQERWAILER